MRLRRALLTSLARPAARTLAVKEGEAGLFRAQSPVPAGARGAAFVAAVLTLGSAVTRRARATSPFGGQSAAPSIVARQLTAGHAPFTVGPGVTELTCAGVSHARAAGQGTGASILTRLRLTDTESALTSPACEARLANALVVVGQLDAVEAVGGTAGVRQALVNVALASFSGESRRAIAAIPPHPVHTGSIIQALGSSAAQPHGWSAVVLVDLTENTQGAGGAGADVMSDQIDARASVLARVRLALVDFYLTVLPSIAWHAVTLVSSHISPAGGAIATRFVLTVVHLIFAVASSVVGGTLAVVGVPSIDTVPSMVAQFVCLEASLAGSCLAGDSRDVTVMSGPAICTVTNKGSVLLATATAILARRRPPTPLHRGLASVASVALGAGAAEGLQGILTYAPIQARLGITLVDFILAVGAGEAGAARTRIAIDFIGARASVEARAFSAVWDVGFAVNAGEAWPAGACVGVDVVCARPPVFAGRTLAFVDLQRTAGPCETWQAATVVRVHPVCAGAPAEAGIWTAVVDVCLAGEPSVSRSAGAHEPSQSVCAGPAVLAGI